MTEWQGNSSLSCYLSYDTDDWIRLPVSEECILLTASYSMKLATAVFNVLATRLVAFILIFSCKLLICIILYEAMYCTCTYLPKKNNQINLFITINTSSPMSCRSLKIIPLPEYVGRTVFHRQKRHWILIFSLNSRVCNIWSITPVNARELLFSPLCVCACVLPR